jgi:mono/diheme cytochrome c family protein
MKPFLTLSAVIAAAVSCASAATVTFNEQIAPIVYSKCAGCHRAGESAPFPLTSYKDVAKRGAQIAAVTAKRYMPPWHAAPAAGAYRDERRLTDEQIALLRAWVDQGMLEGDPAKATALPAFPEGWQLGQPDLVVSFPTAYHVPAEGPDIYRDFVIPVGLPEDKWIRALEVRPTAVKAIHHMLYFSEPTGTMRQQDNASGVAGFAGFAFPRGTSSLGGFAGGTQPHFLPDGIAFAFPKGSDLIIQEHFHPTGKEELEKTVVGLYFAKQAPERRMLSVQLPSSFGFFADVRIPAGDKDFTVRDSFTLPVDVDAFGVSAHAHYLGKSMKLTATLPSGETKVLLNIPNWDFAWQDGYMFADFLPLPKGTRLDGEVVWDNSASNPHNPTSPPKLVTWGEQSRDEMGSVTLDLVPHLQAERKALADALSQHSTQGKDAAFARDPGLKDYYDDLNNGRTKVFQNGGTKEQK